MEEILDNDILRGPSGQSRYRFIAYWTAVITLVSLLIGISYTFFFLPNRLAAGEIGRLTPQAWLLFVLLINFISATSGSLAGAIALFRQEPGRNRNLIYFTINLVIFMLWLVLLGANLILNLANRG